MAKKVPTIPAPPNSGPGRPLNERRSTMRLRHHDDERARWEKAAAMCGLTLDRWLIAVANAESEATITLTGTVHVEPVVRRELEVTAHPRARK